MKELKENRKLSAGYRPFGKKRWVIAQSRKSYQSQRDHNSNIEAAYMRLLNTIKANYIAPGELYYERDLRTIKEDGLFSMHCLVTPTFTWILDCDLCYDFQISYSFGDCQFEGLIRKTLRAYPLNTQSTEITREPNYNAFYRNVITFQDPQFIYSL